MSTDINEIMVFGLSFSRGFEQTWFNLWRKENGFSMDVYRFVDDDDEPFETAKMVTLEQGDEFLRRAFEEGRIDEWAQSYSAEDEGMDTDLAWTLDVDGPDDSDIVFSSGNGKLPPRDMTMGVLSAIRSYEPDFALCFEGLQ